MTIRPMTYLRLVWRVIRKFLLGGRWTVSLPDHLDIYRQQVRDLMRAVTPAFGRHRRVGNRDLLTSLVVALTCGAVPHMEMPYRVAMQSRRSHFNHEARRARRPARFIGRPLVMFDAMKVKGGASTLNYAAAKIGETQWRPGYITRTDQLAARRALKVVA